MKAVAILCFVVLFVAIAASPKTKRQITAFDQEESAREKRQITALDQEETNYPRVKRQWQCANGKTPPGCCENGSTSPYCCENNSPSPYCCENGSPNPDCS